MLQLVQQLHQAQQGQQAQQAQQTQQAQWRKEMDEAAAYWPLCAQPKVTELGGRVRGVQC